MNLHKKRTQKILSIYLILNDLVVNSLKTKNRINAPRAHVQTPEDYHHRPTKASN